MEDSRVGEQLELVLECMKKSLGLSDDAENLHNTLKLEISEVLKRINRDENETRTLSSLVAVNCVLQCLGYDHIDVCHLHPYLPHPEARNDDGESTDMIMFALLCLRKALNLSSDLLYLHAAVKFLWRFSVRELESSNISLSCKQYQARRLCALFALNSLLRLVKLPHAADSDLADPFAVLASLDRHGVIVSPEDQRPPDSFNPEETGGLLKQEALELLFRSFIHYKGEPVACNDSYQSIAAPQVIVRDFLPCALACLMKDPPQPDVVKNFLLHSISMDICNKGGKVIPAAGFKLVVRDSDRVVVVRDSDRVLTHEESLVGFGVQEPDAMFWWILILRAYVKATGDTNVLGRPKIHNAIISIVEMSLPGRLTPHPGILGVHGYPIELQALYYFALACAKEMLIEHNIISQIDEVLRDLRSYISKQFWLDGDRYTAKLQEMAKNEEMAKILEMAWFGNGSLAPKGGYFISNVCSRGKDYRWILSGNCLAILSSLATPAQATAIMDLIEERWEEIVGEVPVKISYPPLDSDLWEMVTGSDPKENPRWSNQNSGSWPGLLWLLTAASIKVGRPEIARRAIEMAETHLSRDDWPQYYDGMAGARIGSNAKKTHTGCIAGYLIGKLLIENHSNLNIILPPELQDSQVRQPRKAPWLIIPLVLFLGQEAVYRARNRSAQ